MRTRAFIAASLGFLVMTGCTPAPETASAAQGARSPAPQYCRTHSTVDGRPVGAISERRVSDCARCDGAHVRYGPADWDPSAAMDHWATSGRVSAARLARAEREPELAALVAQGAPPALLFSPRSGHIEVVYLFEGRQFTFVMASEGRRAHALLAWEPM